METTHKYHTLAWWTSGRTGLAKSDSAPNAIHFSAPPQFGGVEGRWTPEDLLLAALASCFTTTFRAIAGYSKFEYTDLQVEVEGTVSKAESGYSFSEIVLRPTVTIHEEEKRERALKLLQKTQGSVLGLKGPGDCPSVRASCGGRQCCVRGLIWMVSGHEQRTCIQITASIPSPAATLFGDRGWESMPSSGLPPGRAIAPRHLDLLFFPGEFHHADNGKHGDSPDYT